MTAEATLVPAEASLASFLARHPWPPSALEGGRPVESLFSFNLSAPCTAVWEYVSDTSRFNRAMGQSRMEFEERAGVLWGRSKNAGLVQEWQELPWNWVSERSLQCVRIYSRGFAQRMRAIYELSPRGEGCHLDVYFGFVPRGFLGRLLLPLALGSIRNGFAAVLSRLDEHLAGSPEDPFRASATPLSPEAEQRLAGYRRQLDALGGAAEVTERLLELVRRGDDLDVHRIRVLPCARAWGVDEDDALMVFLHATRAGLLRMSWDVVCPHCRGVRAELSTLGEVPKRGSCEVCALEFETDAESAIEVAFHVHPSVRDVPELFYCSAEPARREHIRAQLTVERNATQVTSPVLPPGRYRLRLLGASEFHWLDVDASGTENRVVWSAGADPAPARCGPEATLELRNESNDERTFIIERPHWSDEALRPARLFSFQGFRDLFTEEYVGSDIQLSVGQQTILFTDVVGSTALYAERGDPGAFVDVKRHFADIYEEVRRHHGAVVKTIGDAAMASFVDPVLALRAAACIQRRLFPGREDLALRVRASLHTGPCIAVKLNTNIDYFGSTVNAAAKLQARAGAGEVAFAERLRELPGVTELLEEERANLAEATLESPALGGNARVLVWRVTPDPD